MNRQSSPRPPAVRLSRTAVGPEESGLTYVVELWDIPRLRVERVLARADSLEIAGAVYASAARDYPSRLIVLRQAANVLRSTADPKEGP